MKPATLRSVLACSAAFATTLLLLPHVATGQEQAEPEAAGAERPLPPHANPDDVSALLAECGLNGRADDEIESLDELMDRYVKLTKCKPEAYEAWWRLSRAYWWRAQIADSDSKQERFGKLGYDAGLKAAEIAPEKPEGHYYAAASLGEYSDAIGILRALAKGIEGKFLEQLKAAEKIDPDIYHGGPDRIWCRYYYKLPWPKRDLDDSLKHCREAIEKGPNSVRGHYYIAQTLWDMDEEKEAREHLERCLNIPLEDAYARRDAMIVKERCQALKKEWED